MAEIINTDIKYFVYASISSGKKLADMENNLESSITYKKTIQFLRDNFLDFELEKNVSRDSFNLDVNNPYGTLFIDILMNRDTKHRKLDKIIERAEPGLVLVIPNISVLGNVGQIKNYYMQFQEKDIYVLCFDSSRLTGLSEYSTSDYSFGRRAGDEYERAYRLVSGLDSNVKLSDNRGVLSNFTAAFIESYWRYETYQIPESIAISASGLARSPFHRKCALYERSNQYRTGLMSYADTFKLEELPKRFSEYPAQFKELEQMIDAKWDGTLPNNVYDTGRIEKVIDDACIDLGISSIYPINYKRLKLRQQVGRKGIAASYNYDINILEKYEEYSANPDNPPNEFWEKYSGGKP